MQPAFSRSLSHARTGSGYSSILNDGLQTPGEQVSAPELSKPCPSCPDNISHQVFQSFIEHGKVPDDLSDVVRLGIWCMQNGESKALAHLFEHGHISTADFKLGQWSDAEIGVVIDALRNTVSLTRLGLSTVKLSAANLEKLCDALQSDIRLTSLDLSWNKLGYEAAKTISGMLAANTNLTDLNLEVNELDGGSSIVLGHALSTNDTLSVLNLSCSSLGPAGAQEILAALKANKALQSLDLSGNNLGNSSAEMIGRSLKQNSTLTALNLSSNKIGPTGDKRSRAQAVKHIVDGFQGNAVLKHLDLELNNLDQYIEPSTPSSLSGRLHDLQHRNRTLHSLSKQDSVMFAQPSLPIALPLEVGELLSQFLILASKSTEHYEDTIVDVHAALNACAREAAAARTRRTPVHPYEQHRARRAISSPDSSSPVHAPGLLQAGIQTPLLQQQATTALPTSAGQSTAGSLPDPMPDCCRLV